MDDNTAITGCFTSGNQPLYANPLVAKIGNLTIPRTLYDRIHSRRYQQASGDFRPGQ